MPEQKFYFQWQNKVLKESIYPLREMKLRHVLEFDMEICLWEKYKKHKNVKDLDTIPELAKDIKDYHQKREAVILKSVREYDDLIAYFRKMDVSEDYQKKIAKYKEIKTANVGLKGVVNALIAKVTAANQGDDKDEASVDAMMAKINALHKIFHTYIPDPDFDDEEKPTDSNQPKPMEAGKETYFISQRLAEWDRESKDLDQKIFLQMNRVNAMKETNKDNPNITGEEDLLEALQEIIRPMLNEERAQLVALAEAHGKLAKRKSDYAREVANALKQVKAINIKLLPKQNQIAKLEEQLKDLRDELHRLQTPPDPNLVKIYFSLEDVSEKIYDNFQQVDQKLIDAMNGFHKQVVDIFNHIKDDDVKLVTLKPVILSLQTFMQKVAKGATDLDQRFKEIAMQVLESELDRLNDFKSMLELSKLSAEEIDQAIKDKDETIKKVEGALVDPRKDAEDLKRQIDELDDILHITEEKYVSTYIPVQPKLTEIVAQQMDDFRATLADKDQYALLKMIRELFKQHPERYPRWLQYMIVHFSGMRYSSSHGSWADPRYLYMRLMNPTVTDAQGQLLNKLQKEIEAQMTPEEGLVKLQEMKDKFPPWMWKEIVAVTPLRPTEVDDADDDIHNWERLTPEEQKDKNDFKWALYRGFMNVWKEKYLTSWREEHDRAHRLIVRSSVCNEVAEHIQHLRGHHGAAGLAGKPDWYRGEENKYKASREPKPYDEAPFFTRPVKFEDFRVGASILWLKYKNEPAFQWEVVNDMTLSNGEAHLLPGKYLNAAGGSWNYKSSGLVRSRVDTKRQEYLFWIHEATVACLAETAEGNVVYTFETALPYEDRRKAAVGMFKRNDFNLVFDGGEDAYNGPFLGYVPENKTGEPGIPTQDLDEMLIWDHILL